MAVTARTWVGGEVITAAKLNTIRDDIAFLAGVSVIKSIQHISQSVAVTDASDVNVSISSVVLLKSAVFCDGNPAALALERYALSGSPNATNIAVRGNQAATRTLNFTVIEWN